MRVLGIIPARGGSKRLPGKNLLPLGGVPLIEWSCKFALRSGLFEHVVLSTDDPAIAEAGKCFGVSVPWLRPAEFATDTASSLDVAVHALSQTEATLGPVDLVALLQPTSPFRREETWREAIRMLESKECPAVIGVSPTFAPPHHTFIMKQERLIPLFPEMLATRSQDLPVTVTVNGSLYLIRPDVLRQSRTFFPAGTRPVLCDGPLDSVDIDTEDNFIEAEYLLQRFGAVPLA